MAFFQVFTYCESCYFYYIVHYPKKLETMNTKLFYLAFAITFMISSCQSDKSVESQAIENQSYRKYKNEDKIDEQIKEIDDNKKLGILNGLNYNNNAGSTADATGYVDQKENLVKIDYIFSDVTSGNYGKQYFYIENGKKFASKEIYFDNEIKKPTFVERVSYYDKNEKVVFTKERTADYEEDLPTMAFQVAKLKDCSIKRPLDVLNQTGEFATTFQGIVVNGALKYIIVGENSKDGFASSLAIQYEDSSVKKLINNEREMIGTPLEVQYEEMMDETGLSFQVLMSVKIK